MEKLIIVAGSPNTGKTKSIHILISELLKQGYKENKDRYDDDSKPSFWITETGGSIILEKDNYRILIISYGDIVNDYLIGALEKNNIEKVNCVVCCSHVINRQNSTFGFFQNYIKQLGLNKAKVIPIFKNLLSGCGDEKSENQKTADLILDLINLK